ncbi:MAG: histidine kinase dimerization/phospho-acceptor domain-containing protein, partial [Roseitalea porphyridii]
MAFSETSKAEPGGMTGLARFLAEPAFKRLLALEPWLKRSIPVLILVFLAVVFTARAIALMNDREAAGEQARIFLSLMADAGAGALREAGRNDFTPQTPGDFDRVLSRALPTEALADARMFLIADTNGTVVGQRGGGLDMVGDAVRTHFDGVQPLMMFGADAGVLQVTMGDRVFLGAAALTSAEAGFLMLALQPSEAIYATWRQRASMNVALFVAMASILLILLYAYFGQVARAHEADLVYCETHKRMDLALSRGHCGLWDWDLARGRIYWSRSMFDLLGYAPVNDVLSFGEVSKLVHPEDADLFDLAERAAAMEIKGVDRILRMRHAEGHYVRLRIRTELAEHPGHGNHLIGIAVDMTEQHRLTELSQIASQNLKAAIESTSESFALWDKQERLVLCNRKFMEINGIDESRIRTGMKRADVDAIMRAPVTERRIPQGGDGAVTLERQIADGRWLQINERSTPSGGTISVGADITQLKLQEERLIDSERRLMASIQDLSVAQRAEHEKAQALEDMNRKFLEAKDRAEAASKAKTEFLANVSHELRTPITGMLGSIALLEGSPLQRQQRGWLVALRSSTESLSEILIDLLDLARQQAGERRDRPLAVAPGRFVEEVVTLFLAQAASKDIWLRCELDPDLPARLALDGAALPQVLINLTG